MATIPTTRSRTASKRGRTTDDKISPIEKDGPIRSARLFLTPIKKGLKESRHHAGGSTAQRKFPSGAVAKSPLKVSSVQPDSSDEEFLDSSDEDAESRMRTFKQRQNRIRENKEELIKKLAIVEMTSEIRNSLPQRKASAKIKANQRRVFKQAFSKSFPQRKSLRLLRKDPEGIELPPEPVDIVEEDKRKPGTQFPMEAVGFDALSTDTEGLAPDKAKKIELSVIDYNAFMDDLKKMSYKPFECKYTASDGLQSHQKWLQSLQINDEQVRKVVRGRIFSLALHPQEDNILVAAGDKYGNLGLWNSTKKDSNFGTYHFSPHISPISCLKFDPTCTNRLYMCSYDGQLRFMDLQKNVFEEAIIDDEGAEMSGFDFLDCNQTVITSCSDGSARIIDTRADKSDQMIFVAHSKAAKCISVNPGNRNYVATSCRDGGVHIFDLRKASYQSNVPKPVVVVPGHSRSVSSAYFSPVSGNHLLTTSYDNRLRIFDASHITDESVTLRASCYHNNHTGRWLSSFRACWHPTLDDVFVVGSMNQPRQIDVYDCNAKVVHILCEPEVLGSICSLNCFHPTRNILAGGNSSGKVYLFSD